MDAVDVLILALRLVLVALLYVFVYVVLRMAYVATRPSVPSRLRLRVVEPGATGMRAGEVLELSPGSTLGRGELADVVVADSAVSAEHARVDRLGRRWVVTDLGSTNGTRVNDATIKGRTALRPGDVLSVGTVRLEVVAR
ncbi:MAG: FHA domain-containing protein [Chloroflexi bacterium]|nr:FHA domain-containing protein [Chloroflexota bacterium]MBV9898202.1 FHA domain-containing protein [Chloroflexota bacterium]